MRGTRASVASVLLLTGFLAACGGAVSHTNPGPGNTGGPGGSGSQPPTVAYVYEGAGNVTAAGQISGFSVTSDGVAHALPGSPYAGPSQSPAVSSAFLFATDGTNIQSYTRNADGSLTKGPSVSGTAHNDTPTGSGVGALTLDRTGQSLYAGEINFQGADNNAYAVFSIGPNGALTFVANTPINVNAGGRLTFTANNQFGYSQGCFFLGWDVFGYQRLATGALQPVTTNSNPPPSPSNNILCPTSTAASAKNVLAVAMTAEGTGSNNGQLVTYAINPDGSLTLNPNSIVTTPTGSVPVMAFDPSGVFLAVGGNGVQIYQLGSNGTLTALGSSPINVQVNDLAWDNAGHLYAVSNTSLYVLNFSNGALTVATGSPYTVPMPGVIAVLSAS